MHATYTRRKKKFCKSSLKFRVRLIFEGDLYAEEYGSLKIWMISNLFDKDCRRWERFSARVNCNYNLSFFFFFAFTFQPPCIKITWKKWLIFLTNCACNAGNVLILKMCLSGTYHELPTLIFEEANNLSPLPTLTGHNKRVLSVQTVLQKNKV